MVVSAKSCLFPLGTGERKKKRKRRAISSVRAGMGEASRRRKLVRDVRERHVLGGLRRKEKDTADARCLSAWRRLMVRDFACLDPFYPYIDRRREKEGERGGGRDEPKRSPNDLLVKDIASPWCWPARGLLAVPLLTVHTDSPRISATP